MYRNLNIKSLASSLTVLALSVSLLAACNHDDDDEVSSTAIQTGVFLDSPVINIGYRTETQNGVTNSQGEYKYLAGETVTFFIGDLEFPSVAATGTVTPLTLANTSDTSDPTVVNMIRLLQTLDKDGNLDNGIEITETAKSAATQVNFSSSETDFEASPAVTGLTNNAGLDAPISLVSKTDAVAHFDSELAKMADDESSLNFSESALRNTTLYNVYFDDDVGVETFVVEALSFGGQNTMDLDGESATFSVTNGILRITFSAIDFDDIKIISFDETLNARATCWEMALNPQFNCASNELEYMFSSLTEAEAYRDTQNGTNNETSLSFSESALRNTTLYGVNFDDGGAGVYVVETHVFDNQNGVVVDGELATFSVTDGILRITFFDGFDDGKIIVFDETLIAQGICWERAVNPQFNCAVDELEYFFSSLTDAQAYRDSLNQIIP